MSKADTYGAKYFFHFRQVSPLERFFLYFILSIRKRLIDQKRGHHFIESIAFMKNFIRVATKKIILNLGIWYFFIGIKLNVQSMIDKVKG